MFITFSITEIISFSILLLFLLVVIFFEVKKILKQRFCKHERYYENMRCHAVCKICKKDLGFIGNLKNKRGL